MRRIVFILFSACLLVACGDKKPSGAEALLQQANSQFEQGQYDRALISIDSLRKVYPQAIEARKQALKLYQDIELKRSQEELAQVDSLLQTVTSDYNSQLAKVEEDKRQLRATSEELTQLTKTRVRRDSLQTRYDVLCAKIRYIHKKQKES